MPSASYVFTTPVAQPQQTGVLLGSPISIEIGTGVATVPYSQRTAAGAIPGTDAKLTVALTTADLNSILGIIVARAQALGQPIPAGSMTVV